MSQTASSGEPPVKASPQVPVHQRILQAGKALFATRGYEKASTVAIARLAGTSESQLMKHFGSKEGLLEAIFDTSWERLSTHFAALQKMKSPREKLYSLLETFLNALEGDPATKELMLLEGRRVRKEGNLVVLTRGYLQFVQLVDSILGELKTAGELNPKLDVEAVRSAAIGLLEGMLRDQVLARRMDYPAHFNSEQIRLVFGSFLSAVAPTR
jgi:AcrR family transcriptional regulator